VTALHLTPRQQRWFASIRANFEATSGRSLDEWVAVARSCPHDTPRGRVDWLRTQYGIGVNHAALVLSEAFPGAGWDEPEAMRDALWKEPASRAILDAVEAMAAGTEGLVVGHRKSFTSFSRDVQFAALRPLKGGGALLGLKLAPAVSPRLAPPARRERCSERLTATLALAAAFDVDDELAGLFAAAAARG
jgi:hypothetical protein